MEERMGTKMNMERTDEALASASDTLAVGCPFCKHHAVPRHHRVSQTNRWSSKTPRSSCCNRSSSTLRVSERQRQRPLNETDEYPLTQPTEEMTGQSAGLEGPKTT